MHSPRPLACFLTDYWPIWWLVTLFTVPAITSSNWHFTTMLRLRLACSPDRVF